MSSSDRPDQEPQVQHAPAVTPVLKGRQALSRVRRELSEEEFANPAAQRMMLADLERLEQERGDLLDYREQYFVTKEELAVLKERGQRSLAGEIIFGACLTLSGVLMGYAPTAWKQQPTGWLALLIGAVLLVIGIAARVIHR